MWVYVGGDRTGKPVIPCSSCTVSIVVSRQYGLGDWRDASILSILAVKYRDSGLERLNPSLLDLLNTAALGVFDIKCSFTRVASKIMRVMEAMEENDGDAVTGSQLA
jgi:hypothetical protein